MTRAQRRMMLFIQDRIDTTGVAPNYVEMRAHLGYASNSYAHRLVRKLVGDGYLHLISTGRKSRDRGIRLLRRIEPVIEYQVWDERSQSLVPFARREVAA